MATGTPFEEYKILLIGDVRVGKTSFLTRYTRNVVNKNEQPTIGVDYSTKSIVLGDGTVIKAKIWDTAGSEKYKAITTAHYRKSVGALLFYDLTDKLTFDHTADWLCEIQEHTGDDIVIMLVGNKQDLVQENPSLRKVSREDAEAYAKKYGLLYSETSAKTGYNVKEAFERLVETIYEKQKEKKAANQDHEEEEEEKLRKKLINNFNKPGQNTNSSTSGNDGCCS